MGLEPCIDGSRVARGAMIFWLVVGCGYVFGHVFGVSFAYDVTYKTGGKLLVRLRQRIRSNLQ